MGPFPAVPEDTAKPIVSYTFSATNQWGSNNTEALQADRRELAREFAEVLMEARCFAAVTNKPGGTVTMDVMLHSEIERASRFIMAQISGYFFSVVPVWATFDMTLRANVTVGGTTRAYTLQDGHTLVEWLPLIFVYPFKNPAIVPAQVRQDLYRHLVMRLQRDGLVAGTAPAPPAALAAGQP